MKYFFYPQRSYVAFCFIAAACCFNCSASAFSNPDRWEPAIRKFEDRIASGDSKPNHVMFIGSSSIVGWNLEASFPNLHAVNHGFGGSELADSIHFFERIVEPLSPTQIFIYAGDNDIARGKSPEQVHQDFRSFVALVRNHLGSETKVAFIAIKPSLARRNLAKKMSAANKLISRECSGSARLEFIDIWTPMIGQDGTPRPELFKNDGLHMNAQGYLIWSSIVSEYLPQTPEAQN